MAQPKQGTRGRGRWVLALLAVFPVIFVGLVCAAGPCWSTGLRYGLWARQCPASELRMSLDVSAFGVVRGTDDGWVELSPTARWLAGDGRAAYEVSGRPSRGFDWDLELRDAAGERVEGFAIVETDRTGSGVRVRVRVPAVPDGDYVLRAHVSAPYGESAVDAPLPLYAPALVHVMTDRPLYRAGQTVLFRAAVLRRTDEAPLDGRPGRWIVTDPTGAEVLSERGAAGPWGVAASSFPLDLDAPEGTWHATWRSGADQDQVAFDVRPFRLPRFSVEVRPSRAWYPVGSDLVIEGVARYSSGAPVRGAPVTVTLRVAQGRWPLPTEWEAPLSARTGPDGAFRVPVGAVPADLMDLDRLSVLAEVVEEAGERAAGSATAVLSPEPVRVEALTELGDGLVEGFNNRAYLRVTTPDGRPLPNAELRVQRPYDPADPGKAATTDVDGVAVVQLDPGPPVTVVTPAPPVRPRPAAARQATVTRAQDLLGGSLGLEASRALDEALADVTACGQQANGAHDVEVALRIAPAGVVTAVATDGDAVSRCVAERLRRARFPLGRVRTWSVSFQVPDADTPQLQVGSAVGAAGQALADVVSEARGCVVRDGRSGLLFDAHWTVREGAREVGLELVPRDAPAVSDPCIRQALARARLPAAAPGDALGVVTVSIAQPSRPGVARPQPTTSVAYELRVSAAAGGEDLGAGRLVVPVGSVPPMRLRADPPLAHPGDEVAVELVRGPTFGGSLPQELQLWHGVVEVGKVKVVDKVARFRLPADADGFLHAEFAGARAVVFVAPADPLTLAVVPDRDGYAPGDAATLRVTTRRGPKPTAAAVGLVGVDAMLGQLAPLLGPDDQGRVTVRASAANPAFGSFDPRALALGQIQGENAARAAVLRVSQLPMDPAGDVAATANASSTFDPRAALVENFYRVLLRAASDLSAWEAAAPATELLDPPGMVRIWNGALDAVAAEGHPVTDGYGRRLTLDVVPLDLLAEVDPRRLVSDATRLPEDAEDFARYVQREVR